MLRSDPKIILEAALNGSTGLWQYSFDTMQLADGYYLVLAKALDRSGKEDWSEAVNVSIRNGAVVELLPSSETNRAGRTMPVKFSLRVIESVDPATPFVYNENLEVRIFSASNPETILQSSLYGDSARDYRLDTFGEKYITNFKTAKKPEQYVVEIRRANKEWLLGQITFETVK